MWQKREIERRIEEEKEKERRKASSGASSSSSSSSSAAAASAAAPAPAQDFGPEFQVGDVVRVKEENSAPSMLDKYKGSVGRIVEITPPSRVNAPYSSDTTYYRSQNAYWVKFDSGRDPVVFYAEDLIHVWGESSGDEALYDLVEKQDREDMEGGGSRGDEALYNLVEKQDRENMEKNKRERDDEDSDDDDDAGASSSIKRRRMKLWEMLRQMRVATPDVYGTLRL